MSIKHGGTVDRTPLGATWQPIRCAECLSIVQLMGESVNRAPVMFCGHCKRQLAIGETTASGPIVLVRSGENAQEARG